MFLMILKLVMSWVLHSNRRKNTTWENRWRKLKKNNYIIHQSNYYGSHHDNGYGKYYWIKVIVA